MDAAVRVAEVAGWRLDVDPTVRRRFLRPDPMSSSCPDVEAIDAAWPEIVPRLGLTLHPYQEIGARFLARNGRAFLADDMGLGKTAQSIAAALLLRRAHGAGKALVVCPASLKHQWAREIDKVCHEQAVVAEGLRASRLRTYEDWRSGFLVLNYELVLRDLDAIRSAAPDLVILDEAQRIKNQGTKTARAVKQLESRWAFVLTGTPLENRLAELHSLVEFLHRRALGPRWRLYPFHVVEDAHGRVLAYEGLEVLRRRLPLDRGDKIRYGELLRRRLLLGRRDKIRYGELLRRRLLLGRWDEVRHGELLLRRRLLLGRGDEVRYGELLLRRRLLLGRGDEVHHGELLLRRRLLLGRGDKIRHGEVFLRWCILLGEQLSSQSGYLVSVWIFRYR